MRRFYERLEKAAEKKMAAAARTLAAKKIDVRAVVLIGTPAQEIVKHAAANGVELIVLTSHKIDLSHPAQSCAPRS